MNRNDTPLPDARRPFEYTSLPIRVVFDEPAAGAVSTECERLGLTRVLLIHAPGERAATTAATVKTAMGERLAATFADAREHVPAAVLAASIAAHETVHADGIVAIGGGSAIGLGKLVAAATRTRLVAVPTTYSGAELTPFNAVTENGVKVQRRDPAMLPAAVVYDPALTLDMPLGVTGASMMNALAHAVEALYAPETNPVVQLKAEEAIRLGADAMTRLAASPRDRGARADAMLSAMIAGDVLAVTSVALHHKLCHILGGGYGLPHAATNAVILPYAVAYNAPGAPDAIGRIARALSVEAAAVPGTLSAITAGCGTPRSLLTLGLSADAIPVAAKTAASQTYVNPVPLDAARLEGLLVAAWAGKPVT